MSAVLDHSSEQASKPKLGVSACLMGVEVRFNGGHKESHLLTRALTEYFDFVPACPEVAIGMGIPREAIRLVGDPDHPQAVGSVNHAMNVTEQLADYGEHMATEMSDICGYIFMQKSPSCGLERVKVYRDNGVPFETGGRGIYAQAFCARHPDLPVEEDGRLNDPVLRENFITRVFAYAAWQTLLKSGITRRTLTEFHARYKYQLMANDPVQYKALGNLLGTMGRNDPTEIAPRYFSQLMSALKKPATRRTHTNVLQHLCGYLRQTLSASDKKEIQGVINQYHQGIVPLVVPLTLLKHHFRRHPDPYIALQVYLQPHPENLSLRNAI
ncbi:2-thiouracil desulfurase family protein [Pseudomonas sp. NPDC078416]|uniref:2-thiouracil desulfurase family protein n=1 Tax=Pseudomonas sp. NPDC078416 TaxID=3390637 RepID=UPI003D001C0C